MYWLCEERRGRRGRGRRKEAVRLALAKGSCLHRLFVTISTSPTPPILFFLCDCFVSLLTLAWEQSPHRFYLFIVPSCFSLHPTTPHGRSAAASELPVVRVRGCSYPGLFSNESQGPGPQIPESLRGADAGRSSTIVAGVCEARTTRPTMRKR